MKLKHLALVTASLLVLSSCGGGSGGKKGLPSDALPTPVTSNDPTANASAIAYNDMAVHDPSIIKADNGTYYVFGSHLSVAKSTDLMSWTRVADGVNDQNPIFNTYASQAAEGIEWVGGHQGSWAADVIKLKDGKYYFYYNHCATPGNANGDCVSPRSYIGVAVSSNIEGPYVNKGLILRTGMTDQEIAQGKGPDGVTSFDGATMPNGIDPHVFYDKNGKLWMVYGSYFGGIFILELDESTGAPKAGQGYGKHLAGGGFAPIEGSWIIYSPESDYYYMFNSISGFNATGGYNIRVSRSKSPDGPYLDAAGNNMLLAKNTVETLSKYGVKLMGGFNFVSEAGDEGDSWGYLSPGHNSAYYD
ncbi:MAG TPA: family 43 glycosylhydrolase, partial [Cellvibrio sp.]